MFQDFIKHYEDIREVLRILFLYGCFSKENIQKQKKISNRKLSYELRRIKQYINKDFFCEDIYGKNKLIGLTYDSISNTHNFLVDTYLTKSFTRTDIVLFYGILLILNKSDKKMTFLEIQDDLLEENIIDIDEVSNKTIERKLKELDEELELIESEKIGKTKYYKISKDILKDLNEEQIEKLLYVSELYKNILIPNIAGYFFTDTLRDYLLFEKKINYDLDDFFQYKNLHFHPVMEEEIIWKIMNAIREKRIIKIEYCYDSRNSHKDQKLKPYKIRYDINCGRLYLVSFGENNKCILSRIDRIKKINVLKNKYSEDFKEQYINSMKNSWANVQINNYEYYEIVELKLTTNSKEYIKDRIIKEMGDCYIQRINKNEIIIKRKVNDAYEMIPWIRENSEYLKVISPKWLKKKMKDDFKEMLSNYGSIS